MVVELPVHRGVFNKDSIYRKQDVKGLEKLFE